MTKKRKPRRVKKKQRRPRALGAPAPPTAQQQFMPIHNQALKNSQRDNAEQSRISEAQEREFKMDTLKLQRAYVEKKLSLLV